MALSSLTPLAWRIQDAEEALRLSQQQWARATGESKVLWGQIVNDDLDTLDALRGEAGL